MGGLLIVTRVVLFGNAVSSAFRAHSLPMVPSFLWLGCKIDKLL